MKRLKLIDRARLLHERQEAVAVAARVFSKAEGDSMAHPAHKESARRDLLQASVEYGTAAKRYLGGRGE
jgi:hypothetical protein